MARIDKEAHDAQERGQADVPGKRSYPADGGSPGAAAYSDDGANQAGVGKTTSPRVKPVLKPGAKGDQ
ncbi:MAG TPA: hypothetical protein VEB20_18745 [Azospirillaceae bacterium]|nr:hypothetical protein [Azospirillaceae bacterium]